jgi:DNA-binding transcriptional LysR family regulator
MEVRSAAMPASRRRLDDLDEMLAFVRVVERGSLSAAARALGMTTSAISKRIAAIEGKLRTQLLRRTTRKLSTTEAGQALYARLQRVLAELADAEREVVGLGGGLRGVVRVSASMTFGQLHLAPLLADFLLDNPELRVELRLSDRFVDVVGEDFDVAIRIGRLVDSSLIARKLAPDERVVCAAPAYLEARGEPRTPADLARHNCMRHVYGDASSTWSFEGPDGPVDVTVQGTLHVNHTGAIREAVLRGLGVALLPMFAVAGDVRSGALTTLLRDYRPSDTAIYAVTPQGAHPTAKVRALVDFLAARLPARLRAPG